jgi:hypothetical protein
MSFSLMVIHGAGQLPNGFLKKPERIINEKKI